MATDHAMPEDAIEFLKKQHEQVRELFSNMDSTSGDATQETFDMLLRLLAVHETAEEMVVYPTLRTAATNGNELAEVRLREEDAAKKMLTELEKIGPSGLGFAQLFTQFKDAVLAHAEREEHDVFPVLRRQVTEEQLATMRNGLVAAEAAAPTHPHKNAPESAIGNVVAGPAVAVIDRVRDAVQAVTKR